MPRRKYLEKDTVVQPKIRRSGRLRNLDPEIPISYCIGEEKHNSSLMELSSINKKSSKKKITKDFYKETFYSDGESQSEIQSELSEDSKYEEKKEEEIESEGEEIESDSDFISDDNFYSKYNLRKRKSPKVENIPDNNEFIRRSNRKKNNVQRLEYSSRVSPHRSPSNNKKNKEFNKKDNFYPTRNNYYPRENNFHLFSDDSLSDSDESDEEVFKRREARRINTQISKIRPSNNSMGLIIKEKKQNQLADIDPIVLTDKIDFDCVGGLNCHIQSLSEMVTLPLLYPEIFERLNVIPPRGVLFYGPPGTGKTLIARALASTCCQAGKKVNFFMRKGADCLSKWVGEAERQLRLLFETAQKMQPSIIFFDEIDGLAPVRSSKQDQIHSSIVSTLLALMDGIGDRGQVIVIGATNRLDAIDPALRRPGRFDRELYFPLPKLVNRIEIFKIHTKNWNYQFSDEVITKINKLTSGYCGADIKALCTEASLQALRRIYPEIYKFAPRKLNIDVNNLRIIEVDFYKAMESIIPSSYRSNFSIPINLPEYISPLLSKQLNIIDKLRSEIFSNDIKQHSNIYNTRMLIHGTSGSGQVVLANAFLHKLEEFPIFNLNLPYLIADNICRSAEESCVRIFKEAKSKQPSILYWPHADLWFETASDSLRVSLNMMLQEIECCDILFLCFTDCEYDDIDEDLKILFTSQSCKKYQIEKPSENERKNFFKYLKEYFLINEKVESTKQEKQNKIVFDNIITDSSNKENEFEKEARKKNDEIYIRALRMHLREICNWLIDHFADFAEPVDAELVPDYYNVIHQPISLSEMRQKINENRYITLRNFMCDIDLLVSNCREYHNIDSSVGRTYINKACGLQDYVLNMVFQIDNKIINECDEIAKRNEGEKKLNNIEISSDKEEGEKKLNNIEISSDKENDKIKEIEKDEVNIEKIECDKDVENDIIIHNPKYYITDIQFESILQFFVSNTKDFTFENITSLNNILIRIINESEKRNIKNLLNKLQNTVKEFKINFK